MPEIADAKVGLQNVKDGKDGGMMVTERTTETIYDPDFPDDVYPTEEELATLERHPDSLPLNVFLVSSQSAHRWLSSSSHSFFTPRLL